MTRGQCGSLTLHSLTLSFIAPRRCDRRTENTNMFVAYQVALEVIRKLRPIVDQIQMHDAHLADQLRRAATNTVANLAEGQRRNAGNKRRAYENA